MTFWVIQSKNFALKGLSVNKTQYTQPAIFVVNHLNYLSKLTNDTELPHYLAGYSLGEYNALLAAGVFNFSTGLNIVITSLCVIIAKGLKKNIKKKE